MVGRVVADFGGARAGGQARGAGVVLDMPNDQRANADPAEFRQNRQRVQDMLPWPGFWDRGQGQRAEDEAAKAGKTAEPQHLARAVASAIWPI